jgi:hypothetical protein
MQQSSFLCNKGPEFKRKRDPGFPNAANRKNTQPGNRLLRTEFNQT